MSTKHFFVASYLVICRPWFLCFSSLSRVDDKLSKQLKRSRRKWSLARAEKTNEDAAGSSDPNDVALLAYGMYMKEVIGAILKRALPAESSVDQEIISNAIKITVDISKKIYSFIELAENASKEEDSNGKLSDLIYIKVGELQKMVDEDSPTDSDPVFERFLSHLLSGLPEAQFEVDHDLILTSQPDVLYLKSALKFIRETPPIHLEMFVWWSVIEDLILYTTSSMRQLYYSYTRIITGTEGTSPRPSYCTASVNKLMGFAVSYLIIDDTFLVDIKPKVERMIENIRRSFNNLVHHATWMDWDTKESTLKKSERMKSLIGFPEWILNKTRLELYYKGVS